MKELEIHFDELFKVLKNEIQKAENSFRFFCPFIKRKTLESILKSKKEKCQVEIITSWKPTNIAFGVSDIDIYELKENYKIHIYINDRIHLKTYLLDDKDVLTGSANITGKGLGLNPNYNYETLVKVQDGLNDPYRIYLNKILQSSKYVTDGLYEKYLDFISKIDMKNTSSMLLKNYDEEYMLIESDKDYFLISELPMTKEFEDLYNGIKGNYREGEKENILHDIAIYELDVENYESFDDFKKNLKVNFFKHPFIEALVTFIDEPKRFGAIKEWVQNNCTNVPVPSRRELTGNVQVLYSWLINLGKEKFKVERPRHSEVIIPIKN